MTFSITARCERTGMVGMAVSTAVPAAGPLCVFVRNGVGAVATQSWVNPYLGIDGLILLAQGKTAQAVLEELIAADPGRADRQLGITDARGNVAAFTGAMCVPWAGHLLGDGFTVQGNMLTGGDVLHAMAAVAERERASPLPERLVRALEAGQRIGGDKRGRQSAALKVMHREEFPYVDVRVDDHADPVTELRRVYEVALRQLLPFVEGMPSRINPLGQVPAEVLAMLGKAPAER